MLESNQCVKHECDAFMPCDVTAYERIIRISWAWYLCWWAVILWGSVESCFQRFLCWGTRKTFFNPFCILHTHLSDSLNQNLFFFFYLMFLSSRNLYRHFWMTWSTKSDSRIRFSNCLSFSKHFTWRTEKATICNATGRFLQHFISLKSWVCCWEVDVLGWCTDGAYLHIGSLFVRDEGHACDAA